MEPINGRVYPMWSQFVEKKMQFIGGILEDFGDEVDRQLLAAGGQKDATFKTEITDIVLRPNGEHGAFFEIKGKNFSCGAGTECVGVVAGEEGWITFSGYLGHKFRIRQKSTVQLPKFPDVKIHGASVRQLEALLAAINHYYVFTPRGAEETSVYMDGWNAVVKEQLDRERETLASMCPECTGSGRGTYGGLCRLCGGSGQVPQ